VTKFVIIVIERITRERLVGTYMEDQQEVEVVMVVVAGADVGVMDRGVVDQDTSKHMWPTQLVNWVQAPMTCWPS
jgi:hypothetical protein